MRTIPHRVSSSTGLTYVVHCGCSAESPYQAAIAVLDEKDRWRSKVLTEQYPDLLTGYLAVMQHVLAVVKGQSERSYVHFYPADPAVSRQIREGFDTGRLEAEGSGLWPEVLAAYRDERCGVTVLGQRNGGSTGTAAVLAALAEPGNGDVPERAEAHDLFG